MSTKNNKTCFNSIKGGLSETASDSTKEFVSADVTDTRLMGVVGMCVHWRLPQNTSMTDLYQFFYFDAEEDGFETYKSVLSSENDDDKEEIRMAENTLMGGLGGSKVRITEEEARYILQSYAEFNRQNNINFPAKYSEYSFMLTPAVTLSDSEKYLLMCKQCPQVTSPYQVINYFLMRCYGKDFEAAKFLTKDYVRTNLFPEHKAATLLKNTIEEYPDSISGTNSTYQSTDDSSSFGTFQTIRSYMCESLIEYDGKYFLLVTQLFLDRLRVVKYQKISSFKVSEAEAAMMIKRSEYITVIDIVPDAPLFTIGSTELSKRAMTSDHEGGRLFMLFYAHNDHVKNQVFNLNDDVLGIYFLVGDSQLILSSYSHDGIVALERDLQNSDIAPYMVPVSKYEFKDPVLFNFINSGFDDFEDFVDAIAGPSEDN